MATTKGQNESVSRVQFFAIPWTVAHQVPLSMEFSRQEYWSGLPFPPLGYLPHPGIEPMSPVSPAVADGFFTTELPGKLYTALHFFHKNPLLFVNQRCLVISPRSQNL